MVAGSMFMQFDVPEEDMMTGMLLPLVEVGFTEEKKTRKRTSKK